MYRYLYINKHEQFGRTCCTLILQDLETNMPDVRIEKEFDRKLKDLNDEFLFQDASKEIIAALQAYNDSLQLDEIDQEE